MKNVKMEGEEEFLIMKYNSEQSFLQQESSRNCLSFVVEVGYVEVTSEPFRWRGFCKQKEIKEKQEKKKGISTSSCHLFFLCTS